MGDVRRIAVARGEEGRLGLDELAREGARRMIAVALEAEVDDYVQRFLEKRDEDGRRLVVRNGRGQERRVTVGSGTLPIRAPRVNDRRVDSESGERRRFSSSILPRYARRSPKVTDVLPVLYLRGLSSGDFAPALRELLGEDASRLSASIQRLTEAWREEHQAFKRRPLDFLPLRLPVRRRRARLRAPGRGQAPVPACGHRRPGGRAQGAARRRGWLPRVHRLLGVAEFEPKWPKAVARLTKDRSELLAFYDFPAEHWRHLRTTNPIESSFATVKLRTRVTKGAGSKAAALAMAYKLLDSAQGRWRAFQRCRARAASRRSDVQRRVWSEGRSAPTSRCLRHETVGSRSRPKTAPSSKSILRPV